MRSTAIKFGSQLFTRPIIRSQEFRILFIRSHNPGQDTRKFQVLDQLGPVSAPMMKAPTPGNLYSSLSQSGFDFSQFKQYGASSHIQIIDYLRVFLNERYIYNTKEKLNDLDKTLHEVTQNIFKDCTDKIANEISHYDPKLIVGASFGGAVALSAIERESWHGDLLLLAPDITKHTDVKFIPTEVNSLIVHGAEDHIVPLSGSQEFANNNPDQVRLKVVDDIHPLKRTFALNGLQWVSEFTEQNTGALNKPLSCTI